MPHSFAINFLTSSFFQRKISRGSPTVGKKIFATFFQKKRKKEKKEKLVRREDNNSTNDSNVFRLVKKESWSSALTMRRPRVETVLNGRLIDPRLMQLYVRELNHFPRYSRGHEGKGGESVQNGELPDRHLLSHSGLCNRGGCESEEAEAVENDGAKTCSPWNSRTLVSTF